MLVQTRPLPKTQPQLQPHISQNRELVQEHWMSGVELECEAGLVADGHGTLEMLWVSFFAASCLLLQLLLLLVHPRSQ